jgi:hypothetical protein
MRANDDKDSEQSVMYTVFLSGSRKLSRLNNEVRDRLQAIIDKELNVIVGDANGADKALQSYFFDHAYDKVIVYCSGSICRNNVGHWQTQNVDVDNRFKGRDFYAQKDIAMADNADYGFVIWDGKSSGSMNNVVELLKREKPSVVYFAPDKSFHAVRSVSDAHKLASMADEEAYREINQKIHFERRLKNLEGNPQAALNL